MTDYNGYPDLTELIAFHGHMCPGLAIGYRATMAALEELGIDRSADEEMVAIVENDSCSVDAAQFLAGTTFGKGNFFFRDWGKQVFTFARRDSSEAVRVTLRAGAMSPPADASVAEADARQQKIDHILTAPVAALFDIRPAAIELPAKAEIHRSIPCDACGEPVMETRLVAADDGQRICLGCAASRS
ncbi:MAG: FmdE family protein [Thermoleophilia bacterium]